MSVRGWPGLTLFSIQLSICLSGSASVRCYKNTINSPEISHTALQAMLLKKYIYITSALPMSIISSDLLYIAPCGPSLERTSIRDHFAESSPFVPNATGKALSGDPFWAWLYHISRGGLLQQHCLLVLLCPASASTAIIITGAPQSVIYKS